MTMEYVRKHYGVPVRLHQLVAETDGSGFYGERILRVRSCRHGYVRASADDCPRLEIFHPWTLAYKTGAGWTWIESNGDVRYSDVWPPAPVDNDTARPNK